MDKIAVLIDDLLKLTKSGEITWKPKDQERVVCEDLRQVRCYVYFSKDYLYLAEKSWDVDLAVQFGDPKNHSLKALKGGNSQTDGTASCGKRAFGYV